jgi:hypothetical protein
LGEIVRVEKYIKSTGIAFGEHFYSSGEFFIKSCDEAIMSAGGIVK